MIKQLILLYWFEKSDKTQEHRTIKKAFARWRKHGFAGMKSRLDKEYKKLQENYSVHSRLSKRYSTFKIRLFFTLVFLLSCIYMIFIKSELYESKTALIVRDLNPTIPNAGLEFSLLGMGSDSQLQDSKVVEEYLLSLEMFLKTDGKFHLIQHFKSDKLDFLQRLKQDATQEQELEFYRKRIVITYDELSGILHIAYSHTDPEKAQQILEYLIKNVESELNEFNRKKAKKQLNFIEKEHARNQKRLENSIAEVEKYQNKHLSLDPSKEAATTSEIIGNLEATLMQKKIELSTKIIYLNEDNYEVQTLQHEINEIEKSIEKEKRSLTGSDESRLNKTLFEYERLKMQLDFDTEVYKNALIQLEMIKLDVLKEAKTLSIVSKPNLPDGYTYPNKPKVFVTLLIIVLLLYGIFSMISAIIRDHKE